MRRGFSAKIAAAALLAAGCAKEPDELADDYVFPPVTNACRLIAMLENPSGDPNAVTSRIINVGGMSASGFRRELKAFPGDDMHVWMPGRRHWMLVGRRGTNSVPMAAAMDALAFDADSTSLPELFANYAGRREDIMPAFESNLKGEVVPEWFVTKEIPPLEWLDTGGIDDDILRETLAEIRSMQVVRRVALEGDMLAAQAKDKEGEEKAAEKWARVLLRNPHDLFVLERLDRLARNARGFLEVGKVLQAMKCYETMVLIKPDAANVRAFGTCMKRIGKMDLAEKILKRADELDAAARDKSVADLSAVGHDEKDLGVGPAGGKEGKAPVRPEDEQSGGKPVGKHRRPASDGN